MITPEGLIQLGFKRNTDFKLQDDSDGNGIYVKEWLSDQPQPSEASIETAHYEWQAIYDSQDYSRQRKPNYPPMTDYLDGIVKGDQAQIDKYIADCLAVKEKYPKGDN